MRNIVCTCAIALECIEYIWQLRLYKSVYNKQIKIQRSNRNLHFENIKEDNKRSQWLLARTWWGTLSALVVALQCLVTCIMYNVERKVNIKSIKTKILQNINGGNKRPHWLWQELDEEHCQHVCKCTWMYWIYLTT